jgi:hypothetical protein
MCRFHDIDHDDFEHLNHLLDVYNVANDYHHDYNLNDVFDIHHIGIDQYCDHDDDRSTVEYRQRRIRRRHVERLDRTSRHGVFHGIDEPNCH